MADREQPVEEENVLNPQKEQGRPMRRPMELFGEVVTEAPDVDFEAPGTEAETHGERLTREVNPIRRQSSRERVAARLEAPDLAEGWERAREAEWLHELALSNRRFAPDPDDVVTQDELLELTDGLPDEAITYVAQGQSKDERVFRAKRFRMDYENEQRLAEMGFTGVALRIGAALTDPVTWGASAGLSAVSGPAGLLGGAANRISRVQKIVRGASAGAAGNVAVELAIKANKPIYDDMNILYAAGIGFTIGGGVSALSRNPGLSQETKTYREAGEALKREAEAETIRATEQAININVKKGVPFASEIAVKNSKRFRETPGAEIIKMGDGEYGWRAPAEQTGGNAGAAQVSRVTPLGPDHIDPDTYLDFVSKNPWAAPETAFGRVGGIVSSASRAKSSKNPATRGAANVFVEDAVGNADRNVASVTPASMQQLKIQRTNENTWGREWKGNFQAFVEEQGGKSWKVHQKPEFERQFGRMVTDYVEGVRTDVPASVKKQGDAMRKIFQDFNDNLNQPGAYRGEVLRPAGGFDGTNPRDPTYVPHEFDMESFNNLINTHGVPNVEALFGEAVKRAAKEAGEEIAEDVAAKIAKGYVNTIRKLRVGLGADAGRIMGSGDAEEIKRFLREESEMSAHEIEDAVDALTAKKSGKGSGSKHSKRRTPLDMSTSMKLNNNPEKFGPEVTREVSIKEFFNRDAHDLFTKYNRRMSGEIAMARARAPGLFDGLTNNAEFETLKTRIREIGERVGQSPAEIADDIAQLEYMWKAVKGIPDPVQMGKFGQAMKRIRDWNFMRVMGQVGFAQLPELGTAATGMGLKAAVKSVPGFRTMWRNARTGQIDNALVDELETVTGFGGDWLRMQHVARFDNPTNSMDTTMGSKFDRGFENFSREGRRAVFAGSGMGSIQTFTQRFALAGVANRFADMAAGGKRLSTQRLRAMGLSDEKLEQVLENIRKHATYKDGVTKKNLKMLNLKDWDVSAAADFEEAMFGYTRRLIQENDPGQFRPFMSHPLAQMVLQFRMFMMGAHTKALLHNIHMRDFQTFSTFMASSMLGGLGYMAYTLSNAQGRTDKAEYLEERLSMEKLAKASFERSSWAALIPTAIDTAAMPFTDPIFDFRTTGQSTDILFGNPSSDLADSASSAIGAVFNPMIDGRLPSQQEIRAGARVMPFQNLHGITQMMNLVLGESGLEEYTPKD